jgi:hypothetical protein
MIVEDWADEREEPLTPWARRAMRSAEERDVGDGAPLDWQLLTGEAGEWSDEREEPVRGPLRRALLTVDPD